MAGWTFNAPGTDIDRLEQALAGAGDVDQRLVAEGNFWAAFLRRQRGEVPETSPQLKVALQRGAESSQTLKDPTVAALPKAFVGAFSALTGNLREGARQMREVFDTIEATADPVSAAMVANFLAFSYARLGDFAAAEEINARSERLAGIGDAIALVDAEIARAAIDLERGEPKKATEHALRCAARAEDLGAYACVLASNVIAGAATLALDDAAAARRPVERGNELGHVTNMAPMRNLVQGFLGSVRAQLGDLPGGIAAWDEALANARAMNDRYGEAHTLWGRARTIGRQADPDWTAALADIDRAVELFEDMEARPALARVHHDRAEVLRALGRVDEAAEVDRQSRELGRELGLRDAAFA
jgi:tetratricopeptide (TPR) repeat protein